MCLPLSKADEPISVEINNANEILVQKGHNGLIDLSANFYVNESTIIYYSFDEYFSGQVENNNQYPSIPLHQAEHQRWHAEQCLHLNAP